MNDDNIQMQMLRTQEDVRLHFGIDARYQNTTFHCSLPPHTISTPHWFHHNYTILKQQPNVSSFPVILSRPVYDTYGPIAYRFSERYVRGAAQKFGEFKQGAPTGCRMPFRR